jgi:hypothetical protein
MYDDRPYRVLLAIAIASSSVENLVIASTGPAELRGVSSSLVRGAVPPCKDKRWHDHRDHDDQHNGGGVEQDQPFGGSNGTLRVEHAGREARTDGADGKQARHGLLGYCRLQNISRHGRSFSS